MKKPSFTKILTIMVIVILLANLSAVLRIFGTFLGWFAKALDGLNQFHPGAQSAIAFLSIIWVVLMIYNSINK